mmetsp:Transcript_5228/g.12529  ORF Transcript_5228/g.12529 Transcript_5228/m.12529 type:complete len:234 (+) Transcript_5228:131-832(+)
MMPNIRDDFLLPSQLDSQIRGDLFPRSKKIRSSLKSVHTPFVGSRCLVPKLLAWLVRVHVIFAQHHDDRQLNEVLRELSKGHSAAICEARSIGPRHRELQALQTVWEAVDLLFRKGTIRPGRHCPPTSIGADDLLRSKRHMNRVLSCSPSSIEKAETVCELCARGVAEQGVARGAAARELHGLRKDRFHSHESGCFQGLQRRSALVTLFQPIRGVLSKQISKIVASTFGEYFA